jgi:Helix-turn-helix domain
MDQDDRPGMVLIPFDAREALTLQEAAKIATVSATTVARWCAEFHIGRKIGGAWRVSRVALQMMLDDNGWALMAYLDGDRAHPRVTRYFFDLGLGDILPM